VREAYLHVAPKRVAAGLGPLVAISPPTASVPADVFDPLTAPHVRRVVERLAAFCLGLPETTAGRSFGNPVWRAGKKTFCTAYRYTGRLQLSFWVGVDQQDLLTLDPRFSVPAYLGHNGWIALDAERGVNWPEVEALVLESYRHFALRRMLHQLESGRR
jgi:predicted DNA-binding protein (MmcQ/YjbR family)